MKKHIFPLLIAVVILLTGMVFTAQAAQIPTDAQWIEIGSEADFNDWFAGGGNCKMLKDGYTAGMTRYIRLTDDITVTNPGTYYFNNSTYQVNIYWDLNGKTLTYKTADTTGAARFFGCYNGKATVTIVNGTIDNQSAITGSHGGIFTVNQGHMVMEDVVLRDMGKHAYTAMGKVFSVNAGNSLTLTNVDFYLNNTNNAGTGKGGAIRCLGTLEMTDCTFHSSATGKIELGGILFLDGATVNMTRCDFSGGTAKNGGVIYANASTITAKNCTLENGLSVTSGNNVYTLNTTATWENCDFTVTHTTANSFGGNLYAQGGTTTMTDCTVTGGRSGSGGGMYSVSGALTCNNTTFSGGYATSEGGNLMQKNASLTLENGTTLTGGSCKGSGGNLSLSNTAKFYMGDGIIISGGSAADGGNIHASLVEDSTTAPVLNISGGLITGGSATNNGGNINLAGLSGKLVTLNLSGGTVGGTPAEGQTYSGTAGVGGGNIFGSYSTMNISGTALVSHGFAQDHGGNLYASTASTMNISGGTVTDGVSKDKGGSLYMSSTNTKVNITGGVIKDGFAYTTGGNIYHGNGKLTITGGIISGGRAESTGGNIQSNMGYGNSAAASGKLTICDDGDAATPLPQILNGESVCLNGGNIYVAAAGNVNETGANTFVLGNCILSGGKTKGVGNDLYIAAITDLQILPEFNQTIYVYIEDDMLPAAANAPLNPDRATCTGVFTGKLVLENRNHPYIYAVEGETALYLTETAVITEDGYRWFKTNADAVAAYTPGAVLCAASGELVLTGGDYLVNIAGQSVAITGTGNVTVFDSANDTYELYGSATIDGPTLVNEKLQTVGGKQYYTLAVAGNYTFHRVELTLITASLRPSIGGIYYTGRWSCDEAIKPHIGNFGVAASIVSMPEKDFADLVKPTSKWTVFEAADFESGITKTGVMISGILKDAADNVTPDRIAMNAEYGQKKVHAVAYLNIDGVNYVGGGLSYSLYDILKIVSDNIEDYSDKAETLQSFMTHWSANGLVGEPWDSLDFQVSQDVLNLNKLYGGLQPYYGELHDHAATGGTSDGKQPLTVWKEELGKLKMDFATIVDHRQSLHMYLPEWDNSIFIGGSEAACRIKDRTGVFLHYNMIFSDPAGLEAVVSQFPEFNYREWTEEDRAGTGGQMHFDYPALTAARFTEVCNAVYANGGFVSLVHPKSDGYISSEDPADAYFREGTAIEVFYTYNSTRDGWHVKANYELWTSMIKAGYKVYASAGNDEHNMPSDKAVSVIYAEERSADAWVRQMRNGTFVPGGVGVRSAVGDTIMGGTTAFAGQRFTFSVGDFHSSIYNPDHTYRVDVLDQNGVVFSREVSCAEVSYFAFDADNASNYYYIEVHDVTTGTLLAIGNPIWNADK